MNGPASAMLTAVDNPFSPALRDETVTALVAAHEAPPGTRLVDVTEFSVAAGGMQRQYIGNRPPASTRIPAALPATSNVHRRRPSGGMSSGTGWSGARAGSTSCERAAG